MKCNKKISLLSLLLVIGMLWSYTVTAYAEEFVDKDRLGTITVEMKYDGKPLEKGTLDIYCIGSLLDNRGVLSFAKTADFQAFEGAIDNFQSQELAEQLLEYAKLNNVKAYGTSESKDGEIAFSNLSVGLYMIVQTESVKGYNLMKPFLVSVPLLENGYYEYNINAYGKFEIEKEPDSISLTKPPTPKPVKLPNTGQANWPVPVLAVIGAELFIIGCILRFVRKHNL